MVPVIDFRPLAGQQMQVGVGEEGPGTDEEGLQNLEKLKLNEGKDGEWRLREKPAAGNAWNVAVKEAIGEQSKVSMERTSQNAVRTVLDILILIDN